MTDKDFHPCLDRRGRSVIRVFQKWDCDHYVYILYIQDLYLYSSYTEIDTQWHLTEEWIKAEQRNAPAGVKKVLFFFVRVLVV